jgi:hypothetical protein
MRTHYGPWQPCWISNQHQKHKSGKGPSSEHFWQVWLISVQRFQRRRFKCEKLTDGRRTLTHDKSSHGLWSGELKNQYIFAETIIKRLDMILSSRRLCLLCVFLMEQPVCLDILSDKVVTCYLCEISAKLAYSIDIRCFNCI